METIKMGKEWEEHRDDLEVVCRGQSLHHAEDWLRRAKREMVHKEWVYMKQLVCVSRWIFPQWVLPFAVTLKPRMTMVWLNCLPSPSALVFPEDRLLEGFTTWRSLRLSTLPVICRCLITVFWTNKWNQILTKGNLFKLQEFVFSQLPAINT